MKILTKPIEKKLRNNFNIMESEVLNGKNTPKLIPPLKLFGGSVDILILWIDFDNDVAFGIFNLGLGVNEIGSNSWSEILKLTDWSKNGLRTIEREKTFKTSYDFEECCKIINSKGWRFINV
jgi:hypothetical protein